MRYAAAIVILGAAAASAFAPSDATVRLPSATSKLSADRISKHTASAILGARGGFTVSSLLWCGAEQQLFIYGCALVGRSSCPSYHFSMYVYSCNLMNILQYFFDSHFATLTGTYIGPQVGGCSHYCQGRIFGRCPEDSRRWWSWFARRPPPHILCPLVCGQLLCK